MWCVTTCWVNSFHSLATVQLDGYLKFKLNITERLMIFGTFRTYSKTICPSPKTNPRKMEKITRAVPSRSSSGTSLSNSTSIAGGAYTSLRFRPTGCRKNKWIQMALNACVISDSTRCIFSVGHILSSQAYHSGLNHRYSLLSDHHGNGGRVPISKYMQASMKAKQS